MPQPFAINFGPWVPDGADVVVGMPNQYAPATIPLADCLNVYWSDQGYRSLSGYGVFSNALSSQCLGAFTALDVSTARLYCGTSSDLFYFPGAPPTNVSKSAGAYTGTTFWSFAQFGGCICAANGVTVLQDMTLGGANFADLTGSPIARVLGVIGQSLMAGDIVSPTAYPYRVQWSGIGNPTSWPTPLTNAAIAVQSGYQDLTQEFGHVMFIAGGPLRGVLFQQLGITLATYQGGDVVFSFQPFERKRGLIARGAACQVGDVTHFIGTDGFYMTDGSQVIPTGSSTDGGLGIDKWFKSNVNLNALSAISSGYDSTLKCVAWAIPTGSNTLPDTLLLLNPRDARWTRASLSSELIWSDIDSNTRHRLSVFDQTHKFGYLNAAAPSGYVETYDGAFLDGRVRDVVEGQLNGLCTDTPTMKIGYRESLEDAVTYSAANTPDSFSRRVTWDPPPAGRFVRVNAASAAASALNGATIYTELGGV